jgi:hypothetical protein
MLRTIYFVPAPLTSNSGLSPGPELQLIEEGIKMYQVWALTPSFALKSTLCAAYAMPSATGQPRLHITVPTNRVSVRQRFVDSTETMSDTLVVGDELVSEDEFDCVSANPSQNHLQEVGKQKVFLRPGLDWRGIFRGIYVGPFSRGPLNKTFNSFESMSELVANVLHSISQRSETDTLPMTSL